MRAGERQEKIVEMIGQVGQASVQELVARFGVSPETIRRDLGRLAEDGLVLKVHGGAKRARLHTESPLPQRMVDGADAKRAIARKLAGLLEPGDTIFMDTGSTTRFCAELLAQVGPLTVITNSIRIAETVASSETGSTVYLLGGQFAAPNGETYGSLAISQLQLFQADYAVITVTALDARAGAADADFEEASIARAMIARARRLVVVADASKFSRVAAHRVCDLREIDVLVCDRMPGMELAMALQGAGVEMR